ncbi:hypothetical protein DENSPDRAFT_848172 [Dentipellis sp. KUC8613]|nr:hypothetical protein DENSPDRAFT_848172 [Dentipellis sp. KUC8613]
MPPVSSDASTSSTLVERTSDPEDLPFWTDPEDEQLTLQFDYMLPIPEHPEGLIPAAASSILLPGLPDEPLSFTPASSSHHLLSPPSPTGTSKPRLWLHRRRRTAPVPSFPSPDSPPRSPTDSRASFLASLLHARWPKTEAEDPIFGQTTPRALSPCRQHRPPSTLSTATATTAATIAGPPRSILTRADSRASKRRGPGSVKFAEMAQMIEYACAEIEPPEDELEYPFDEGFAEAPHHRHQRAAMAPGTYGYAAEEKWLGPDVGDADDGDSVITFPPPSKARHNDSIFRRFIGSSGKSHAKGRGERPVISGPFPLARAASLKDMKECAAGRSSASLARSQKEEVVCEKRASMKEKESPRAGSPTKKANKLRTFWGKLYCGIS